MKKTHINVRTNNGSFYLYEAPTDKTFKCMLRNEDSIKEMKLHVTDFTRSISSKRYRNYSAFDRNKANENFNDNSKKDGNFKNFYKQNYETNFNKNNIENEFSSFKRGIQNIAKQSPLMTRDSFKMEKLYEGNSAYSGNSNVTTVKWNISDTTKNIKPLNQAKQKFINDMLNNNPLKEKNTSDNNTYSRRTHRVSEYLGSSGVKDTFPIKNINYDDIKSNKITNTPIVKSAAINNNKAIGSLKYRHLYEDKRGFYL